MKRWLIAVLAGCTMTACGSHQVNLVLDPQIQQFVPNPNMGDTVSWSREVQFIPKDSPSPCETGKTKTDTCKLVVNNQFVFYKCPDDNHDGCPPDPEMPVGPADGDFLKRLKVRKASADYGYIIVYCNNAKRAALDATFMPGGTASAPAGATVAWKGGSGATNWTVAFDNSRACSPSTVSNSGDCTLQPEDPYPYDATYTATVNSSACSTSMTVKGTLRVTMP
jgi:hypothetical protein